MAQRPVFIPCATGDVLVRTVPISFDWSAGLSLSQKQKSIASLHAAAASIPGMTRVLEISTKSRDPLGTALSAFNLSIKLPPYPTLISVESAFQGSKVFEGGGPFVDIHAKSSVEAKRDPRLRDSGRLTGFQLLEQDWPLEPATAFYDWLYISALRQNPKLGEQLHGYTGFTDIEFNPERSINCQAYSAALFVSLCSRGMFEASELGKDAFLDLMRRHSICAAHSGTSMQPSLF